MKDKNTGAHINQDELQHYLRDIRKIKVMTAERERELAKKMKSEDERKCLSFLILGLIEANEKKGKPVSFKGAKIHRLVLIASMDCNIMQLLNELVDVIEAGGDTDTVVDELDTLIGDFIDQAASHLEEEASQLRLFVASRKKSEL